MTQAELKLNRAQCISILTQEGMPNYIMLIERLSGILLEDCNTAWICDPDVNCILTGHNTRVEVTWNQGV